MTEKKTKKCEVCGARKPIEDFSKAYKCRCKACVAEEARMHRASQEAEANRIRPRLKDGVHRVGSRPVVFKKARIRTTGEIVDVTPQDEAITCKCHVFKAVDGRVIPASVLQFEPEIDWEQRTYEIAQSIMAANMSDMVLINQHGEIKESLQEAIAEIAEMSVYSAKVLIAELQKGNAQ